MSCLSKSGWVRSQGRRLEGNSSRGLQFSLADGRVGCADVAIHGSRAHETWGLVIDECMARGLPRVLPRAGAYPERIEEGSGALFYDRDDAASLARVIDQLLAAPGLIADLKASLPPLSEVQVAVEDVVPRHVALYEQARKAGAPKVARDIKSEVAAARFETEWDRSLPKHSPTELGLTDP